jgi:hypothetical protein
MNTLKLGLWTGIFLTATLTFAEQRGGQDGGGGNVKKSTAEEVKTAIEQVRALYLMEEVPERQHPLFWSAMVDDENWKEAKAIAFKLTMPFTLIDPEELIERAVSGNPQPSDLPEYLKMSRIKIKEDGPCPAHGGKEESDASVSANKFGADICFSVPRLQRIPNSGLYGTLVALFGHEITHLAGFGEREADLVQEMLAANLDVILNRTGHYLKFQLTSMTSQIQFFTKAVLQNEEATGDQLQNQVSQLYMYAGQTGMLPRFLPDVINDATVLPAQPQRLEKARDTFLNFHRLAHKLATQLPTLEISKRKGRFKEVCDASDEMLKEVDLFLYGKPYPGRMESKEENSDQN